MDTKLIIHSKNYQNCITNEWMLQRVVSFLQKHGYFYNTGVEWHREEWCLERQRNCVNWLFMLTELRKTLPTLYTKWHWHSCLNSKICYIGYWWEFRKTCKSYHYLIQDLWDNILNNGNGATLPIWLYKNGTFRDPFRIDAILEKNTWMHFK